jgi:hypothetical protein
VSFSSGSAVDAALAGVPSLCLSANSFAWEVSRRSLADLDRPWRGDRAQWLANLAYVQWSADEIGDGACWRHLRKLVEGEAGFIPGSKAPNGRLRALARA